MTATAISALRSSSSRDGIGRPTALGALAARGVVEHELDVDVLSDGGSLRRYLWARSPPREPVRERDSVAFSPYAALAMAAIIGRKARTWSKCLVRTVFRKARLGALEDLGHHDCGLAPHRRKAGSIRHQSTGFDVFLPLIDCRKLVFRREGDDLPMQ
jgi:hypothetical protein